MQDMGIDEKDISEVPTTAGKKNYRNKKHELADAYNGGGVGARNQMTPSSNKANSNQVNNALREAKGTHQVESLV